MDTSTEEQLEYYKTEHKHIKVTDTPFVNLIVDEFLIRGNVKNNEKLLELGSGYGRFSIPLLQRGFKVDLSDVVPELLKELTKNIKSRELKAKVISLDINKDSSKEKYDIICGFHVLHHLADLKTAFMRMSECLNPNGRIIFVEPNAINPLYYIHIMIMPEVKWKYEKGILRMRNNLLEKTLKEAGFRYVKITNFGFFPDFVVNRRFGTKLEKLFNKTKRNPMGLFKLIVAGKK